MKVKLLTFADGTTISDDSPVFIIAEIGQNHQGDINIAKKLIIKAKVCHSTSKKIYKHYGYTSDAHGNQSYNTIFNVGFRCLKEKLIFQRKFRYHKSQVGLSVDTSTTC